MRKYVEPCLWGILLFLLGSTLLVFAYMTWEVAQYSGGFHRNFWENFPGNVWDHILYWKALWGIKLISRFYLLNVIFGVISGLLFAVIQDKKHHQEA